MVKEMEKNNNNNNDTHNNTHNFMQLDLYGNIINNIKLKGFQQQLLETLYLNKDMAITQAVLFNIWGNKIHSNTINNFIKSAFARGWICKLTPKQGLRVSNAYIDYKQPDYLEETGQKVYDKRYTYYKITKLGEQVYEMSNS